MLSAQDGSRRGQAPMDRSFGRMSVGETVTLSGTMVVANGMPALKSGEDTYLLGGIGGLVGFVDGLKEGAQVTVEGTVIEGETVTFSGRTSNKILQASKLTLNGKSYDLASPPTGMGLMLGLNFIPNGELSPPDLSSVPRLDQLPNLPGAPRR